MNEQYRSRAFSSRSPASCESDSDFSDADNSPSETACSATDSTDCALHLSTASVARETDSHLLGANVVDRETAGPPHKVSAYDSLLDRD